MKFFKIWIEQCEAARGIEGEFGTDKALTYLVREKFLNFLEAADNNAERGPVERLMKGIRRIHC